MFYIYLKYSYAKEFGLGRVELPKEMVHSVMLKYFEHLLIIKEDIARKIAERHEFSDEEISEVKYT